MSINIPNWILELKGQCVNTINCNEYTNTITISCRRDKRFTPIDPMTHSPETRFSLCKLLPLALPLYQGGLYSL